MIITEILLDTHILLWLINDDSKLQDSHRRIINSVCDNDGTLFISIISIWEVALLVSKGRLKLGLSIEEFIKIISSNSYFKILPIDIEIVIKSCNLGDSFHSDPADRFIVATSIITSRPLLTKDSKILAFNIDGFVACV